MPNTNREQKRVAIAILAAGKGSRFNQNYPKSLALLRGRSLLVHALNAAMDSRLTPVLLVVGYKYQQVAINAPNIRIVHNPHWRQGIASSLQAAIKAIELNLSIGALCIGLADQPLIGADAYCCLASAYREGADFAVATYEGARRNPVLLARSMWSNAIKLDGDEGARVLMSSHSVVEVACDRTGSPRDVDTVEDLQELNLNNYEILFF